MSGANGGRRPGDRVLQVESKEAKAMSERYVYYAAQRGFDKSGQRNGDERLHRAQAGSWRGANEIGVRRLLQDCDHISNECKYYFLIERRSNWPRRQTWSRMTKDIKSQKAKDKRANIKKEKAAVASAVTATV